MKDKKTKFWIMRATKIEKANISKLAKRLQAKEAEAVRQAVNFMLESTEACRDIQSPRSGLLPRDLPI